VTEAWRGFTSLADADARRAFLATTRSVIDPGGQTVTAHVHLPMVVEIPTLVVWGTRDKMIPTWHATTAHQAIPGSRVELFEGAGHYRRGAERLHVGLSPVDVRTMVLRSGGQRSITYGIVGYVLVSW
jgi:fermentation-respiration switch protein FrsA (DUF1100 family)